MPPVHRNSDSRSCGATTTVVGQSTVFVNGLLVSVEGDPNTHGGGELDGSLNPGTILIEGKKLIVVGSHAARDERCGHDGHEHCDPIAIEGSPDVTAF